MPVNILNLPGLNVLDFKETDAEYHIRAEPAAISRLCPHCGRSHDTIKHAQKTLFVRDLPSHGKSVAIHLDAPRLLCKLCNKTFTAAVPEVDIARQMTERLAHWIGRQSLEYTYAEIAKQVNVDEKTVRNIFDEYVARLMCLAGSFDDDYETKIQTRKGNLGTDLPTLLDLLNKEQF